MQWPLILSGLALGVAATPHCAVMCGAPCAMLTRGGRRDAAGFHGGRWIGYVAAGALAAGSVGLLARWTRLAPALHPLWTLMHLGFLALGLWWMLQGRAPRGLLPASSTAVRSAPRPGNAGRPGRALGAGLAWVAWPCPALQGALMLAALANDAPAGGLVMAAFAVGSAPGLGLAHWAWRAGRGGQGGAVAPAGFRIAGLGLVMVSGWALTRGLWPAVASWCLG